MQEDDTLLTALIITKILTGEDAAENCFLAFILHLLPTARPQFPLHKMHFALTCKLPTSSLEARKPNIQLLFSSSLILRALKLLLPPNNG